MDLLSEAPSSDPEIKPGLAKTSEWNEYAAVISPSYATRSMSVECGRRPAADAAASSTSSECGG